MARFSIQHNINVITALAKSSADAMTVLDAMDDIVDAACEECAMNPRCQFNDCEHCRLRQVHDQLTVEVLDKDELVGGSEFESLDVAFEALKH